MGRAAAQGRFPKQCTTCAWLLLGLLRFLCADAEPFFLGVAVATTPHAARHLAFYLVLTCSLDGAGCDSWPGGHPPLPPTCLPIARGVCGCQLAAVDAGAGVRKYRHRAGPMRRSVAMAHLAWKPACRHVVRSAILLARTCIETAAPSRRPIRRCCAAAAAAACFLGWVWQPRLKRAVSRCSDAHARRVCLRHSRRSTAQHSTAQHSTAGHTAGRRSAAAAGYSSHGLSR